MSDGLRKIAQKGQRRPSRDTFTSSPERVAKKSKIKIWMADGGRPYTRCPTCRAQITAVTTSYASKLQIQTQILSRLRIHETNECRGAS